MEKMPRHECLIYEGSPASSLPRLAALAKQKLNENNRCLYLNSSPMVTGMRSYLFAAGVDPVQEIKEGRLLMSSDQGHLVNGRFDVDRMLSMLDDALNQALSEGYQGLWATGDMTWEFGLEKDFAKLLEYEWRLEDFFSKHPALSGICQYHTDTLPREVVRQGVLTHPTIFINEMLSRLNPHYIPRESFTGQMTNADLEAMIKLFCESNDMN